MPDERFNGRTVLITGAGGGIGAAIARRFADHGATLVLNDLRPPSGEEPPCAWVAGDLRDPQVVRDLIATAKERTGRIDVFVNAAGIQLRKPYSARLGLHDRGNVEPRSRHTYLV